MGPWNRAGAVAGAVVALVLAVLPGGAAGGAPFEVTVGEPAQTPIEPGLTEGRLEISTHHSFQPGANYLATLQDPQGVKSELHGLLDDQGVGEVVFRMTKAGRYTMRVVVVSDGRRETGQVQFESRVEAQPDLVIVDGPGAGAIIESSGKAYAPPIKIAPPPPNRYPGIADASGTITAPAGKCKVAAFHGTLYGSPDPSRPCGWGHAVFWGDATKVTKFLASTLTDTHLALEQLARHGAGGAGLAFRALENTLLSAVIDEVSQAESSERLQHSSAAFILERLNKARDGVNRIFLVLRNLAYGRGGAAQLAQVVSTLKGTLPDEEIALERLAAHELTLVSDAPEFEAFAIGSFQGAGTLTLQVRIATSPPQPGASYHLVLTGPDGHKQSKAGTLGPYGLVLLTFPAPKLNIYTLAATVVGAQPIDEEFSTGRSCPGGGETPLFTLQPPIGSTGPSDVPIHISAEIVPCDTPDGKPHAPPTFRAFTAGGGVLPIKDGKLEGPVKNFRGNWAYAYSGTVTITGDTRYYTVTTWH